MNLKPHPNLFRNPYSYAYYTLLSTVLHIIIAIEKTTPYNPLENPPMIKSWPLDESYFM